MPTKPSIPCNKCGGVATFAFSARNILGPYSVEVSYVYECPCGHQPYEREMESERTNRAGRSARHAWKDYD